MATLSDPAPQAMATYSGAKDDCELPVGQVLLKQAAEVLSNAVVTTDALHSQKTALMITAAGGDYVLALKDNQATLCQLAREKLDGRAAD